MLTYHSIQHEGQHGIKLSGVLTIYTVASARQDIPARLAKNDAQLLDLSGVQELDTAGIQLLLWLKREAKARGGGLAFIRHSPAVVEVLDQLKLAGSFGDPILIAPSAS